LHYVKPKELEIMSYEIIYARQFIKAEKENKTLLLPFILTGSNNCYESNFNGRERRARDWWNWNYYMDYKPMGTLEEILSNIDKEFELRCKNYPEQTPEEIADRWNNYSGLQNHVQKGDRLIDFKRFFINGLKQAITVEQLVQGGEHIYITTGYIYHDEVKETMQGKERFNKRVETTQELFDTIEEAKEYHKDLKVGYTIHLSLYNDKTAYTRLRRNIFGRRTIHRRERILTKDIYGIKIENYGYFYRRLKGSGFKYAYSLGGGKLFPTEQAAKRKLKELEKYISHKLTIEHEHYPNGIHI
jgi:hypothetical protein